jgi:hypothetical protein
MAGACSTHSSKKKRIQNFTRKNGTNTPLEKPAYGRPWKTIVKVMINLRITNKIVGF